MLFFVFFSVQDGKRCYNPEKDHFYQQTARKASFCWLKYTSVIKSCRYIRLPKSRLVWWYWYGLNQSSRCMIWIWIPNNFPFNSQTQGSGLWRICAFSVQLLSNVRLLDGLCYYFDKKITEIKNIVVSSLWLMTSHKEGAHEADPCSFLFAHLAPVELLTCQIKCTLRISGFI